MTNGSVTPSRLTIDFMISGYPCHLELEVNAADFAQRVQRAVQTIAAAGGTVPVTLTAAPSTPPSDTPVCPYHGAMKESTKRPGTWFCSHKMGDGSYCKEHSPK